MLLRLRAVATTRATTGAAHTAQQGAMTSREEDLDGQVTSSEKN